MSCESQALTLSVGFGVGNCVGSGVGFGVGKSVGFSVGYGTHEGCGRKTLVSFDLLIDAMNEAPVKLLPLASALE
jgi:hypothetical protein